jgi:peptidoglycan/LPS O-acetylase OafA/YrhL
LLHQPLLNIYSYAIDRLVPVEYRFAPLAFFLVAVTWLAVMPFSVLWYKLFELPGIALGKLPCQREIDSAGSRGEQQS